MLHKGKWVVAVSLSAPHCAAMYKPLQAVDPIRKCVHAICHEGMAGLPLVYSNPLSRQALFKLTWACTDLDRLLCCIAEQKLQLCMVTSYFHSR